MSDESAQGSEPKSTNTGCRPAVSNPRAVAQAVGPVPTMRSEYLVILNLVCLVIRILYETGLVPNHQHRCLVLFHEPDPAPRLPSHSEQTLVLEFENYVETSFVKVCFEALL